VILFIGAARLFDMATGVNGEIILQSRYYRFNLISVAMLAVLIIGTNYIFIPLYGINGAAFATALSVFLYNIIKFLFLWIKFRMQPFSVKTIFIVLIAGVTFFAASLVPAPKDEFITTVLNILFRSAVITCLFVSLTYAFQVSEDANNLARLGLEKLRGMIKKAA
jgi:O-antigen/teichoic acid export membrane protein